MPSVPLSRPASIETGIRQQAFDGKTRLLSESCRLSKSFKVEFATGSLQRISIASTSPMQRSEELDQDESVYCCRTALKPRRTSTSVRLCRFPVSVRLSRVNFWSGGASSKETSALMLARVYRKQSFRRSRFALCSSEWL